MKIKTAFFKILFASSLMILFSCTGNGIKDPEQIGEKVFEVLKDLSTKSKSEYLDNFISINDLKIIGNNIRAINDEKSRNQFDSYSKKEIEKSYWLIKAKGGKEGINWQEIKYLDSIYKISSENGLKKCGGILFFKHGDQSYRVLFMTLFDGTEYKLAFIVDLEKN